MKIVKPYVKITMTCKTLDRSESSTRSFCVYVNITENVFRDKLLDALKDCGTDSCVNGIKPSVLTKLTSIAIRVGRTSSFQVYVPPVKYAIDFDYTKDWLENVVKQMGYQVVWQGTGISWMNKKKAKRRGANKE